MSLQTQETGDRISIAGKAYCMERISIFERPMMTSLMKDTVLASSLTVTIGRAIAAQSRGESTLRRLARVTHQTYRDPGPQTGVLKFHSIADLSLFVQQSRFFVNSLMEAVTTSLCTSCISTKDDWSTRNPRQS